MAKKLKPFAVFDIDGTLIRWQLYHAMTDSLARFGHIDPVVHETVKAARNAWKRRRPGASFSNYEKQVIEIYEKALFELNRQQYEAAVEAVFEEYKDQVYVYTRELIATLKKQGYLLFAVSGSQSEIVAKIAQHYGFDDYVGTAYEFKNEHFTGNKSIGSHDKDKALKTLVAKHGASLKSSVAIGDSHSDVPMLELVEQPIAFNPEGQLFEHAKKHNWKIVIERKNIVYELDRKGDRYVLAETGR